MQRDSREFPQNKYSTIMTLPFPQSITRLTAGGWQLWTDHIYRDGYRIQKYSLSDEWRVLNATNHRLVSGSRRECQAYLDRHVSESAWNEIEDPFVVLSHGLLRSSFCMVTLQKDLIARGFKRVIRYAYASTRASLADHGAAFAEFVESLPQKSKLDFVGHSMGNIVLRAAIGQWQREGDPKQVLHRMHRVVMLGPPNQGAMIAKRLAQTKIFEWVAGVGAMELGPRWEMIQEKLGTPPCPFAIIAGDRSRDFVWNPLVDGPSDYMVSVEEAKLMGASKLVVLPVAHGLMMSNPRVRDITADFLADKTYHCRTPSRAANTSSKLLTRLSGSGSVQSLIKSSSCLGT
jgi:alpha-beta hydrolase superfamily lysophospholipase